MPSPTPQIMRYKTASYQDQSAWCFLSYKTNFVQPPLQGPRIRPSHEEELILSNTCLACTSSVDCPPSSSRLPRFMGQKYSGTEQPYLSGIGDLAKRPPALARFMMRPSRSRSVLSLDAAGLTPPCKEPTVSKL